jgi:hypothetical protein
MVTTEDIAPYFRAAEETPDLTGELAENLTQYINAEIVRKPAQKKTPSYTFAIYITPIVLSILAFGIWVFMMYPAQITSIFVASVLILGMVGWILD